MNEEKNFVGYEYREVTVKERLESMYIDGYMNFGWKLEGMYKGAPGKNEVILKLKRDRKVRNKAELARLQRQFEVALQEVNTLENSKVIGAATVAYTVGIIGTTLMAGSVFAYNGGLIVPAIMLAVPAFLGWILPYLLYCNLRKKKSAQVEPMINQKYDEVYQVCEKANELV